MNKRLSTVMAILAAQSMLFIAGSAIAGDSDTGTVTYQVTAINEIAITNGTIGLVVSGATAGSAPTQVTDSDTYAITTNADTDSKKITAKINAAMDSGLTLGITVTAPTGATSTGAQTLSDSAVDVVTGVEAVAESELSITYTLDATVGAGVIAESTKTVTLTITDS
ncbi:MAG: hypothetical protein P8179_17450 [Candidatus Thiodiazotropha sp.]